ARVVGEPELSQHVARPVHVRPDREIRRPIAADASPGETLEQRSRTLDVVTELAAQPGADRPMTVAVAGDFVTASERFADERRKALGDVTEEKERGARAPSIEQIQETTEIVLHAWLRIRRCRAAEPVGIVIPVLDVDREGVRDRSHRRSSDA